MNRLFNYLKQPVLVIGWWTGIDVELPRWLNIFLNISIGIIMFIAIGQLFRDFFGLPFPFKI